MTPERKKQIEEAAKSKTYLSHYVNSTGLPMYRQANTAHFDGFMLGAEWADANPVSPDEKDAEIERLRELLEDANGWVKTHSMQTYNKRAADCADRIDAALEGK